MLGRTRGTYLPQPFSIHQAREVASIGLRIRNYDWIGGQCEGLRVGILIGDEAVDGGLEIDVQVERAALEAADDELGKEAIDRVEPRA